MKITLLFGIAMLIGIGVSFAQQSAEAEASATILAELKITKDSDIRFGNVSGITLSSPFLDPLEAANSLVGSTATTGKFTIEGANQSIKVSWPANTVLSTADPTPSTMVYNVLVAGNGTNDPTGATVYGTVGVTDTAIITPTDGTWYLFVGGNLGGTAGTPGPLGSLGNPQAPGTYTADLTFTVEYN